MRQLLAAMIACVCLTSPSPARADGGFFSRWNPVRVLRNAFDTTNPSSVKTNQPVNAQPTAERTAQLQGKESWRSFGGGSVNSSPQQTNAPLATGLPVNHAGPTNTGQRAGLADIRSQLESRGIDTARIDARLALPKSGIASTKLSRIKDRTGALPANASGLLGRDRVIRPTDTFHASNPATVIVPSISPATGAIAARPLSQ